MQTTNIEYRGFVIEQVAVDVWYVRRPGSWLECIWAPRTTTAKQQERRIDQWHHVQDGMKHGFVPGYI